MPTKPKYPVQKANSSNRRKNVRLKRNLLHCVMNDSFFQNTENSFCLTSRVSPLASLKTRRGVCCLKKKKRWTLREAFTKTGFFSALGICVLSLAAPYIRLCSILVHLISLAQCLAQLFNHNPQHFLRANCRTLHNNKTSVCLFLLTPPAQRFYLNVSIYLNLWLHDHELLYFMATF